VSFWDVIWFIVVSFVFIAYLMILFSIFADLISDGETKGWVKAVWVIALIMFPLLSALVYFIVRGSAMADRSSRRASRDKASTDSYIRGVAATSSPAEQIGQAKALLDAGTITQQDFDALKAKAIG
jgi:NhaP-type Na+/H+ or K+/H+ antiporter